MLKKAIQIRLNDPRIILNELFGYLSFSTGLITAYFVITENHSLYGIFNQIMLASCGLQNIPLLMIYIPQWRVLISTGILGIIVTNYFATNPLGNAFREGLFVGMIKVDYSYEALHKYYPENNLDAAAKEASEKLKPDTAFVKARSILYLLAENLGSWSRLI